VSRSIEATFAVIGPFCAPKNSNKRCFLKGMCSIWDSNEQLLLPKSSHQKKKGLRERIGKSDEFAKALATL
jgi:hypothetical protein